MTGNSLAWNAVRLLAPVRSPGVHFVERLVRGDTWLFLHNDVTGQHVRINELARRLVQALDGTQSVDSLVREIAGEIDDVEKEAIATNLLTLSKLGMLTMESELSDQLVQQRAQHLAKHKKRLWHNPLAIRIPLFDPNLWLTRVDQRVGFLIGPWLVGFSIVVVVIGLFLALLNTDEIISYLKVLAESPQQWWQFIVIYPLLKCLHEFSHAIAIKRLGGNVHEAGLTILVLMPVPYVDATDIWRLDKRQHRILVSSAGMLIEGFVAALALLLWLVIEPGRTADFFFVIALTGSVTTLLFNANPLLKFDGYQILQDAVDIPNLATRSSHYVQYVIKRYLLGASGVVSPVTGPGERSWLFCYALAAVLYRWVITLAIALYLATRFPVLGGLLAIFALYKLSVTPILAAIRYLLNSAELDHRRPQAAIVSIGIVSVVMACVFLIPLPTHTRAHGVVDVPHQAQLFAPQAGELAQLFVKPGDKVEVGQPILRVSAPQLKTQADVMRSQLNVLELDYQAALINAPVSAASLLHDIQEKQNALAIAEEAVLSLVVHSNVAGRVSLLERYSRLGEFVGEGDALGHVVNDQNLLVKAVVPESDIARVEQGVRSVSVRLSERFRDSISGQLLHMTPSASRELSGHALAALGGDGGIAVASTGDDGWKTIEPVFHLEVGLPADTRAVGIGGRAYVTLLHSSESIGVRSWRALRRLVLDELAL